MLPEPYERRASSRLAAKRAIAASSATSSSAEGPAPAPEEARPSATRNLKAKRRKNAVKMAKAVDIVLEASASAASVSAASASGSASTSTTAAAPPNAAPASASATAIVTPAMLELEELGLTARQQLELAAITKEIYQREWEEEQRRNENKKEDKRKGRMRPPQCAPKPKIVESDQESDAYSKSVRQRAKAQLERRKKNALVAKRRADRASASASPARRPAIAGASEDASSQLPKLAVPRITSNGERVQETRPSPPSLAADADASSADVSSADEAAHPSTPIIIARAQQPRTPSKRKRRTCSTPGSASPKKRNDLPTYAPSASGSASVPALGPAFKLKEKRPMFQRRGERSRLVRATSPVQSPVKQSLSAVQSTSSASTSALASAPAPGLLPALPTLRTIAPLPTRKATEQQRPKTMFVNPTSFTGSATKKPLPSFFDSMSSPIRPPAALRLVAASSSPVSAPLSFPSLTSSPTRPPPSKMKMKMAARPPPNDDFTSELDYFRQTAVRSQKLYRLDSPPPASPIRLPLDPDVERNAELSPAVLPPADLVLNNKRTREEDEEDEDSEEDSDEDSDDDEEEEERPSKRQRTPEVEDEVEVEVEEPSPIGVEEQAVLPIEVEVEEPSPMEVDVKEPMLPLPIEDEEPMSPIEATPEAPEVIEIPATPEAPEVIDVPPTPEAAQVIDVPAIPEGPEVIEILDSPEPPAFVPAYTMPPSRPSKRAREEDDQVERRPFKQSCFAPVWLSVPPKGSGAPVFTSWSTGESMHSLGLRKYFPPPPRPTYRPSKPDAPDPLSVEEYSKSNFEWKARVEAEEARRKARAANPLPPVWTRRVVRPKPPQQSVVKRVASVVWGFLTGR